MLTISQKDNGPVNEWNLYNLGDANDHESYKNILPSIVKQYFLPYLNVAYDCGLDCKMVCDDYRMLSAKNNFVYLLKRFFYVIYLTDGSSMMIAIDNNGKELGNLIMYIDINGLKKPNTIGKDVFSYHISTSTIGKANFWGLTGATVKRNTLLNDSNRGCNRNASGEYCGALIQYDGWKISDDYPW